MINFHFENELDLAQLFHLKLILHCYLDLLDLYAGIGCDDNVVNVEPHIHVVSVLALEVDVLICPLTSKTYL